MNEESLFQEALSRSPSERAAFLEQACAGRPELRAAVEGLVAAHERSGHVLDQPPPAPRETVDSRPGPAQPHVTGEYTPEPACAAPSQATTAEYVPNTEPGAAIAGRYILQKRIGEGGMGEVWVAKQTEPVKRKVALKLIKAGMDTKAVLQRFEAERQALALMDHPNIARVFDGGMTADGRPFFVMELVNGLPLTQFCDEAQLGIRERLDLFVGICQAVQHAHQKGIIHRDLKPSNILVTVIDARPVPKVIDFGVAKAIGGKLLDESVSTQVGAVVGTLEYMAPEQAGYSGTDIDTRADIYSLGVVLYELLTGLRPIDGKRLHRVALTEMIRIIQEEEPSKPSTRLSTDESLTSLAALRQMEPKKLMAILRGELDWVVMKCLEKQRDRRYETANGLARDIERYLADEAVEARPPSAGYRLRKFAGKHRAALAAATAVAVLLVSGMSVSLWQMQRAIAAEAHANNETAAALAAREQAEEEKGRAERHAATVQAIADFFSEVLFLDNTKDTIKGNEDLVAVANRMVKKLEGRFPNQPKIEFLLRERLATVYYTVHLFAAAKPQMERELTLCRQLYGEDDKDTLLLKERLAWLYSHLGEYAKAEPLLLNCLDGYRRGKGEFPSDVQETQRALAAVYLGKGDYVRAENLLLVNLRHIRAQGGEQQADLSDEMLDLGAVNQARGTYDQAERCYLKSWNARQKRGNENLEGLAGVAEFYQARGMYDKVEHLFDQEKERGELGFWTEEETARGLDALAASRLARKKYGEAEEVLRRSVEIWEDAFPDGWRHFYALSLLGGSLAGQKKYAAAEPLLLQGCQGLEVRQAQIPPHQRFLLFEAVQRLVQLYEVTGKQDKAALWKKKVQQLQANQMHPIRP